MTSVKIVRPHLRKIAVVALMVFLGTGLFFWFATYFFQEGLKSQDTVLVARVNGGPVKDDTVDTVVDRVVSTLSKYRLHPDPMPSAQASETPESKAPTSDEGEAVISDAAFNRLNKIRAETGK